MFLINLWLKASFTIKYFLLYYLL